MIRARVKRNILQRREQANNEDLSYTTHDIISLEIGCKWFSLYKQELICLINIKVVRKGEILSDKLYLEDKMVF